VDWLTLDLTVLLTDFRRLPAIHAGQPNIAYQ
jgi:hypothetical protein